MYETVFLEHGGVSTVKAAQSPPSLKWDWSDLQNENKYNEGSEPVSLVKKRLIRQWLNLTQVYLLAVYIVVSIDVDKYEFSVFSAT